VTDGITTGAVIEANVIYGNGARGGAGINLDGVQSSIVRDNVLYANHASGITNFQEDGAEGPRGMEIVGNTIVMAPGSRNGLQIIASTGPNRVRDNILYHPDARRSGLELRAPDVANVDSDYNALDRVGIDDDVLPLADFQTTYHKDMHSIAGGTPADLFVNAALNDYALAPGSKAVGKGTFEAQAPVDRAGKARPKTAPDIGALQR
jgi:hypothetical protein